MQIRSWVFAYVWALLCSVGVGAQFGLSYGNIVFSALAFIITLADATIAKATGATP